MCLDCKQNYANIFSDVERMHSGLSLVGSLTIAVTLSYK